MTNRKRRVGELRRERNQEFNAAAQAPTPEERDMRLARAEAALVAGLSLRPLVTLSRAAEAKSNAARAKDYTDIDARYAAELADTEEPATGGLHDPATWGLVDQAPAVHDPYAGWADEFAGLEPR